MWFCGLGSGRLLNEHIENNEKTTLTTHNTIETSYQTKQREPFFIFFISESRKRYFVTVNKMFIRSKLLYEMFRHQMVRQLNIFYMKYRLFFIQPFSFVSASDIISIKWTLIFSILNATFQYCKLIKFVRSDVRIIHFICTVHIFFFGFFVDIIKKCISIEWKRHGSLATLECSMWRKYVQNNHYHVPPIADLIIPMRYI